MLLNLKSSGALDNTFFLLLGDHGFQVETTIFFTSPLIHLTPRATDINNSFNGIYIFQRGEHPFTRSQQVNHSYVQK